MGSRARIAIAVISFLLVFGATQSWAGKAPKQQKITDAECLACHADASMAKEVDGKQASLAVDEAKFKGSVHSVFSCTDCHSDIKSAPHENPPAKPQCATCHAEEQAAYDRGFHSEAVKRGDKQAANCQSCHGAVHEILPSTNSKSKGHRQKIPATG